MPTTNPIPPQPYFIKVTMVGDTLILDSRQYPIAFVYGTGQLPAQFAAIPTIIAKAQAAIDAHKKHRGEYPPDPARQAHSDRAMEDLELTLKDLTQ